MHEAKIKEFNYTLESDALLDIYSTAGEEEVNNDHFEILTNKHQTILILASAKGERGIGGVLSEMASSQALEIVDSYPFHQKSSEEIENYLKEMLFLVNDSIVEYLEVANIDNNSTTLSVTLIYKNSLYTAHIGENRIYLIYRDDTPILISKDPSYRKHLSKNNLEEESQSYYLGDANLDEEKISITHEPHLHHKDTVFLCSNHLLETLPEEKFSKPIETIDELLEKTPSLKTATFLRYSHYERSVNVLRIEKEEIEDYDDVEEEEEKEKFSIEWKRYLAIKQFNIEWEKYRPIIKKVALILGTLILFILFYQLLTSEKTTENPNEKNSSQIQEKSIKPLLKENPIKKKGEAVVKEIVQLQPITEVKEIKEEPKTEQNLKEESEEIKELKILHKAESDILYVENGELRITFKEKQLIASQKEFFHEKESRKRTLYATLYDVTSEQTGDISIELSKQNFSSAISLKNRGNKIELIIKIKPSCHYVRSNWAKKSGLDLLTFQCEE